MHVNAACVRLYYLQEVTQNVENINIFVPIVVETIVLDTIADKHKITGCFIRCFMMQADGRGIFFSYLTTLDNQKIEPGSYYRSPKCLRKYYQGKTNLQYLYDLLMQLKKLMRMKQIFVTKYFVLIMAVKIVTCSCSIIDLT